MSEEIGITPFGIPACTFSKACPNGPCLKQCYGRVERSEARYREAHLKMKEIQDAK